MQFLPKMLLSLVLYSVALPVGAQEFRTQSGDQRISGEQLAATVRGKKVRFSDGAREEYNADGTFLYVTSDGRRFAAPKVTYGKDGVRCIEYPQGTRCDLYVVNNKQLVLVNAKGDRYPARLSD